MTKTFEEGVLAITLRFLDRGLRAKDWAMMKTLREILGDFVGEVPKPLSAVSKSESQKSVEAPPAKKAPTPTPPSKGGKSKASSTVTAADKAGRKGMGIANLPTADDVLGLLSKYPEGVTGAFAAKELGRSLTGTRAVIGQLLGDGDGRVVRIGPARGPTVRFCLKTETATAEAPIAEVVQEVVASPDVPPPPIVVPKDATAHLHDAEVALTANDPRAAIVAATSGLHSCGANHLVSAAQQTIKASPRRGATMLINSLRLCVTRRDEAPVATQSAPPNVQAESESSDTDRQRSLLLAGGIGRMESIYRDVAEAAGFRLDYAEKDEGRIRGKPDAIILITTNMSHPMLERAVELAERRRIPIVRVQEPSKASISRGVAECAQRLAEAAA